MKTLTIAQYEELTGIPNRTIRNKIDSGDLPSSREKINNRKVKVVQVDDIQYEEYQKIVASKKNIVDSHGEINAGKKNYGESPIASQNKSTSESYQEAEIIEDLEMSKPQYNLISMENDTFENLIQNIKDMADDRSQTEKDAYKRLEQQYFQASQQASEWRSKAEEYRIESIQAESDSKIKDIRIKELEEKLSKYEDQEDKIKNIEQQLSNSPWWSKKL